LMELGALVCVPNGMPLCKNCPVSGMCKAYKEGMTDVLPVKSGKKPKTVQELTVFVIESEGKGAVQKRPAKGLLAGLWEFPNARGRLTEAEAIEYIYDLQFTTYKLRTGKDGCNDTSTAALQVREFTHVFTHRVWSMRVYYFSCDKQTENLTWAGLDEVALPTAFRKLVEIVTSDE